MALNDEKIAFWRKYGMTFHTSIDGGPESHDSNPVQPISAIRQIAFACGYSDPAYFSRLVTREIDE
jgi:AraC-like DNA-binding protein